MKPHRRDSKPPKIDPHFLTPEREELMDRMARTAKPITVKPARSV